LEHVGIKIACLFEVYCSASLNPIYCSYSQHLSLEESPQPTAVLQKEAIPDQIESADSAWDYLSK